MSFAEEVNREEWMEKIGKLRFQRAEMNRLIMDYLVTEGYKEAAEKFRIESGTQPTAPLDSLDDRIKIREAVQKGDLEQAVSMTNKLNPDILDSNQQLYFHLQQQRLIELIREKDIEAAVEFAQGQFSEQGQESGRYLEELEQTMALLAFDNPEESPFGDLLHTSQRQKVASELNAAILEAEHKKTQPKLANVLKLLLWAQDELEGKKVKFPKMTEIASGTFEESR
ncbi:glucose-induced degradation protein 8 homolog [Nematostella vectensis]|uniref:glucose-induced degradation protein 8 homolog n=1 Tax=Nematostella vectensis TaxID=45351 RepID=UPI0020775582|nr:glucose-induced degradation protein 8 homolog [Nematostella vectensis]